MMPKLPRSALLTHSKNGESLVEIYSLEAVRAIQEEAYKAGMAAERERCAQAVVDYSLSSPFDEDYRSLFAECAEFVRNGSTEKQK